MEESGEEVTGVLLGGGFLIFVEGGGDRGEDLGRSLTDVGEWRRCDGEWVVAENRRVY